MHDRYDEAYATEPPPWDIGHPQPALHQVAGETRLTGHVLDVGCGTGEHALMAAERGHPATGIDLARLAIDQAQDKATKRGSKARFVRGSVLELEALGERYDTVLDCGLYHSLDVGALETFKAGLRVVVRPGGRYFMLAFSDRLTRPATPLKQSPAGIRAAFADGWLVEEIVETTILVRGGEHVPALLSRIRRV